MTRKCLALLTTCLLLNLAASQGTAWATQCSDPNPHCYAWGTYVGGTQTGKGVTGLITVYAHVTQNGSFTATFNLLFIDANNWMSAGIIDGDSVIGLTAVPRGYSDWKVSGVYGHTGFLCTPTPSTMPRESVVEVSNYRYTAVVCGTDVPNSQTLSDIVGALIGETEISNYLNTCYGHYTNLKQRQAIGGTWNYWDVMSLHYNNPLTVQKDSNSEFSTCGG